MSPEKSPPRLPPLPVFTSELQALKREVVFLGEKLDDIHDKKKELLDQLEASQTQVRDTVPDGERAQDERAQELLARQTKDLELDGNAHARQMSIRREEHSRRMAIARADMEREALTRRQQRQQGGANKLPRPAQTGRQGAAMIQASAPLGDSPPTRRASDSERRSDYDVDLMVEHQPRRQTRSRWFWRKS